jgi:isocitrate dehydrogenase
MMLVHLNESFFANKIRNALYKTIEDGIHTADIFNAKTSTKKVGTKEFTQAVIKNLNHSPSQLAVANFKNKSIEELQNNQQKSAVKISQKDQKSLIGLDLFIDWNKNFDELLNLLKSLESEKFELKMISAKGLLLFPLIDKNMMPNYDGDLTTLRFVGKGICGKSSNEILNPNIKIEHKDITELLNYLIDKNIDFVKYEGLYLFNDKVAFTSGQGE